MRLKKKYLVLLTELQILLLLLLKIKYLMLVIFCIDYNTKVSETQEKIADHDHDKYNTSPEFNTLTAENVAARLAQANLAS